MDGGLPIVAVYNSSGTKVATYTYTDAWGNHSVSYINGGASTGAAYNPKTQEDVCIFTNCPYDSNHPLR